MRYVLDSSVALKLVLPEPDSGKVIQLRDETRQGMHELLTPDVFPIEVAHALARAERQKRISQKDGWLFWKHIMSDAPILQPYLPLMPRAYEIASAARIGVYDCLYVALAEREGCDLLTADAKLVTNLKSQFPFIVGLDSLP
jgi:predicted nucleic acid-binding protein